MLYAQRRKVLTSDSLKETILGMIDDIILDGLTTYANEKLYLKQQSKLLEINYIHILLSMQ